MNNPLVSIIIPTYNYAHLINMTLISVVNQTYTNWECIIIDDGSTDNTKEVVEFFIQQHPKLDLHYITLTNGGTSAAKNAGAFKARGELLQFLDADDLISAEKLKVQVELITNTDAALVFSASQFFKMVAGRPVIQQKYPDGFLALESLAGFELFRKLIKNNILTIGSPLVWTSLFRSAGKFEPALRNNEDWLLWFKIALLKPLFLFDNDPSSFVQVRLHNASAMMQHQNMFLGEVIVRESFDQLIGDLPQLEKGAILQKLNKDLLSLHRIRSLEIGKGLSWIMKSFINNPAVNYRLLLKGSYKLSVRLYKSLIR